MDAPTRTVSFPDKREIIAAALAVAPFVCSFSSASYSTSSGVVTSFSYFDPAAVVLGIAAITVTLSNIRLIGQSESPKHRLYRIALIVGLLLLAAFHILRGFGLFIDPQAYMDAR